MKYQYSENGLAMTKSFEGLRLTAYQDVAGVWTIGYGHTGLGVSEGLTITEAEAEVYLRLDMLQAVTFVTYRVKVPITQNQFDALVDFCFNVGCGSFEGSTLLKLVNQSRFAQSAAEFAFWNHAGGKEVTGLTRRRAAEAKLFMTA
jgi:lysozyme